MLQRSCEEEFSRTSCGQDLARMHALAGFRVDVLSVTFSMNFVIAVTL